MNLNFFVNFEFLTLKKDLAHFYKNVSRWREDEKVKIALACT